MERIITRQQRDASRAYSTSTQPKFKTPNYLVLFVLYTLQASFVAGSADCALFEVQFPFDLVTPTQSNQYIIQVLPPQSYSILSIAAPIGVQTSRMNPSQFSVQLKNFNLTASIMVQQCDIVGSYQLRMVQSENHSKVVSLINGVYFDYVKARSTSQTVVTKIPRIAQVKPNILESGKIVTIKIAEDSFDYRKPIKCLFITPNYLAESQALIKSNSSSEVSCTVPTDPRYQDCHLAILNSQVLSQIQKVQLAMPPLITDLQPPFVHVNQENQNFVVKVELSFPEVKNIWARFLGQQRVYPGVLLYRERNSYQFLIRVNLDYIVPNFNKQTKTGALEISINEQDFTPSNFKITFLPPFSIDYITQTNFQLGIGVQIELFVRQIHPNGNYTCQIKTQQRVLVAPAIVVPNNFQTSDTRGRNHKYKMLCNLQSFLTPQQFKIGIESNGLTDWYARSLIFEDIPQRLKADPISTTNSVSVDGDYFKSSTFIVEEKMMNQTLYLAGQYTGQYRTNCVFIGTNFKSQTTMRAVNQTTAICQLPALPYGDYILTVGNSEFKFIVIQKPNLTQRNQIVSQGPITFDLSVSLPNFDQSNVTCTFTTGVTIGRFLSNNFSSMLDAIECDLPQNHSQEVFTLMQVQLTSYLHIFARIATAFLPFSDGIWHPDQNDYLLLKDTIDFTNLLPALRGFEGLECIFQFTSSDERTVVNYAVPLSQLKCVFDPHLDFDAIVKTCSQTTLTLAGLTFVNEFKYCGESFLFIEEIYPSLLLQNQFRITLNRDVQVDLCRLNGFALGSMYGQICTLNTTDSIPTDQPITFEVSYNGKWLLQAPYCNKVVKPSNLPSFKSKDLLYNPYSPNTIQLKGFNLVKNAVYYISFGEFDTSVIKLPDIAELNQVIIAGVPPLQTLNLLMIALDGQRVTLGAVSLTYLPRIVSKTQVFQILDSQITPVEIYLDQAVLVQQVSLIPEDGYEIFPRLRTPFTFSYLGSNTIVRIEIGSINRDLAYHVELKVLYKNFEVVLPTNTTIELVTKVEIQSVWLQKTGIRIISRNAQGQRHCNLTYTDYTKIVVFDQGVCKTTDLNIISVSVGNSDETYLCHVWVNLSFEPLVFNYQTSLTVNGQIENLILLHQDGRPISYYKNGSNYYYQTWQDQGQVKITLTHNQCILHGQTLYTQFIVDPIQILNVTATQENIKVELQNPITSELLSQLSLNLGWMDFKQEIDTYHALLVKSVAVTDNYLQIKSERGLPDFVELSYKERTVAIYVTQGKIAPQQKYQARTCNLEREKIQINETIGYTQNIRYDLNMTCTDPIEMNETQITYQSVQKSLGRVETKVEWMMPELDLDVANRPFENLIVNIQQSLQFQSAKLPPIILRKFNSTQIMIHFHTNETNILPKASVSPVESKPISISKRKLQLYKTSTPQLLSLQISHQDSEFHLTCFPLEPTRYYTIDQHTLVIYYKHVTVLQDTITCSIAGEQFQIEILSALTQVTETITVNQAEEVSIQVPAHVVCSAQGVQIRSENGVCKINTAFFSSPTQIDLILPLTTESSLLIGTYNIVQQPMIDDILSVHSYVMFSSSDLIKSEQLSAFYSVNGCNLTMTICDTLCFEKQMTNYNPLSGVFTFKTTKEKQDPIVESRVTIQIKIQTASGNLTTHAIIVKYLKNNIIQMPSPSFMLDGFLIPGIENLQLKTSEDLKIGSNQAVLSYITTDEDYQFNLINIATPKVSLSKPVITQFGSNSLVVIQVICDSSIVMPHAKLFYKLTEELLFQQDAELWYIYLGLSDFQQKSFAYGDVTLHLGSHIIQVTPYTYEPSLSQPKVQNQDLPALADVVVTYIGPQLLVRDMQDTQMVFIATNTTQYQAQDYICGFQILDDVYRYTQAYGDSLIQKMACSVPKLRKLQNNVTLDILVNNQRIINTQVVIPITDPLELNVTLLSHTKILVNYSHLEEVICMTNGTYQVESIKGGQVITVPLLRYGMIVQCGFALNQLQALSSAPVSDSAVQKQRNDYFKRLMLVVKSVGPQIVQLPYQLVFVTIQFAGQLQLQQEDLLSVYLEDPISGQVYTCQLLSGNRFLMPKLESNETEYLQILSPNRKPLQARIYLQKPIRLFDAELVLTKSETYIYQQSQSQSLIPAQDLKIVASLAGAPTLSSAQCTYLLSGLLCRFKDKFLASQHYTIITVFGDQEISRSSVMLSSDFQETIPITVWPLEQIAPELLFQVLSKSQLLIPSTCLLIYEQTTLLQMIVDSACSFQAIQGKANLIIYDQSGFQIYESPVWILGMPLISTITPDYFVASHESTVLMTALSEFDSDKFNLKGLPLQGVNRTQFKVTIPANFFTFPTDQPQVEPIKLTHLASGKAIVLPQTLLAYPTPIKNPTMIQSMIDTNQNQILKITADFIAPLPDFHIFCFETQLPITLIANNSIFFQLEAGMPSGTLEIELYQNQTYITTFNLAAFQKYQKPQGFVVYVAESELFSYEFLITLPDDFKVQSNVECEVNGMLGTSRVLDQQLFCTTKAKQRGVTVELKFYVRQLEYRILIASDSLTYRIVPLLQGVRTYTQVLIRNTPGVVKLSLKSGFIVDQTFCILDGYIQAQMLVEDNGFYKCDFTASQLDQISSTVELRVSNFIPSNNLLLGHLDVPKSPFFDEENYISYSPSVVFQGHKQTITASVKSLDFEYFNQQSLNSTCLLQHEEEQLFYTLVPCMFTDESLCAIELQLPAYKLKPGNYYLKLTIEQQYTFFLKQSSLRVELPPQIIGLFPTLIHTSKGSDATLLEVRGRNFLSFSQTVRCVLIFDTGSELVLDADVVSDSIILCKVRPLQVYSQAFVQLQYQQQRITLNFNKKDGLPKVQFTSPLQIKKASPKTISIGADKATVLEVSHTLKPKGLAVLITCVYSLDFGQIVQQSAALSLTVTDGAATIECESIQSLAATVPTFINLGLIVQYKQDTKIYQFESLNKVVITALPIPEIVSTEPSIVYNLIAFKQLTIKGSKFYNSNQLKCVFGNVKTDAVFVSEGNLQCIISQLKFTEDQNQLRLQVTNDGGATKSNVFLVTMAAELPRVLSIEAPQVLFTGSRCDVVLSGTSLHEIQLKVTQGPHTQFVYCNATNSGSKIQCFDLMFLKSGLYRVSVKNPLSQQYLKSNVNFWVHDKMLFNGITQMGGAYVGLDLNTTQLLEIQQRVPQIKMECLVFGDDAVLKYRADIKVSFIGEEFLSTCALDCGTSRFLEFTVWLDRTIKLVQSTHVESRSRYMCQPTLHQSQQIKTFTPLAITDAGVKPQVIELLPELKFDLPETPSVVKEPRKMVLSKPVYDSVCAFFPTACVIQKTPYLEFCSISGGLVNQKSKFFIVEREESRLVSIWGHNLDISNPVCVFGGTQQVAATVVNQFNIQCTTPQYQTIDSFTAVTVDIELRVGVRKFNFRQGCNMTLIQMPQIKKINDGAPLFMDEYQEPDGKSLDLQISYPEKWDESGYSVKLMIYCDWFAFTELAIVRGQVTIPNVFGHTVWWNYSPVSSKQCQLFLQESQRDTPLAGVQAKMDIFFLLDFNLFAFTHVDNLVQFVNQNDKVLIVKIAGKSLEQVTDYFGSASVALVAGDSTIISNSFTAQLEAGTFRVLFRSREFRAGEYCLEIRFGAMIQSSTCSKKLTFKNQPTIWEIVDLVVSVHSLQSVVKGVYLDGLDLAGIQCLYQRYNGTSVYQISTAKSQFDSASGQFTCTLPDVYYDYFSSDKIFTLGLTTQTLDGQQVTQSDPNAKAMINPSVYPVKPVLSKSQVYCESFLFVKPTCSILYSQNQISCSQFLRQYATPSVNDVLIPDHSLIKQPVSLQLHGHLFDPQVKYLCSFSRDYVTESTFISSQLITCQTPIMLQNQTISLLVQIYRDDGVFVHEMSTKFTYFSYNELPEIYPLLAPASTPTQLLIKVKNLVVNNLRVSPLMCKFNFKFDGTTASTFSTASVMTELSSSGKQMQAVVGCLTPNMQQYLNNPLQNYTDTFVALTELDGTYRLDSQIRFTFVHQIVVSYVEPDQGYVSQVHLVTVKGTNFLPEASLQVRMRSRFEIPNQGIRQLYVWSFEQIFFLDQQTLVVKMPDIKSYDLRDCNQAVFEVSINNGTSWTTDLLPVYTFKPAPSINSLSHYNANLRAFFVLTVRGINFDDNIHTCYFGSNLESQVTFVNSTAVQCPVPVVWLPQSVPFALMTKDMFMIKSRTFNFTFSNTIFINRVSPLVGGVAGGYPFTLYGNYTMLMDLREFQLFWNEIQINEYITEFNSKQIMGTVPPATHPGRAEIRIEKELVVYQNISVYFMYGYSASVQTYWPNSGPSSGKTMVTFTGEYFNDQIVCEFAFYLEIVPIRVDKKTLVCEMPPHAQTGVLSLNLKLWKGNQYLYTGYTYFYYNDIIINDFSPKNITTNVRDQSVVVTVQGLWFLQSNAQQQSFRVRINGKILPPEDVEFVSSTMFKIKPPNVEKPGHYHIYVSNNFGVDFARGSQKLHLNYYMPHQIKSVYPDHIQIPTTSTDSDIIKMNITLYGNYFPTDSDFYCRLFDDKALPLNRAQIIKAVVKSSTEVVCNDIWLFNSVQLPSATYFRVQVSMQNQEYWGDNYSLYYYPKVTITRLSYYLFQTVEDRLVFEVYGSNFINTANCANDPSVFQQKLACRVTNVVTKEAHISDYVYFDSPTKISCTFNKEPLIGPGEYKVAVSNNNIQFVDHEKTFVIKPPIYIVNIWPKTMLTRTTSLDVHKIQIEAIGFLPDVLCYFLPTTLLKGTLYETPNADLIVVPQFINATHISCQVPSDLTDIGEVDIDVHLGNSLNPDTIQQSGFQIRILDHCPNGYFCHDLKIQPCPVGHYCPGESFLQDVRQCQVGYYQPKTRSQRCYPCLRGHYCASEQMINPTPCPDAKICDIHKLSSPRDACPKGMYCIEGTQGDEPWYNGYFVNQTFHCAVGTYCRGGHKSGTEVAPLNYEAVPTACQRGLICHQGSYQVDGNGDCPSGYFCPHRNHTGILCPPRFYCPGRGNVQPIKCPKGTFNMHFGQKNCTDCTLGRICHSDGMFLPMICPAGMVCNDEKLVTPQHICATGHVCLGENMSGLEMNDRACKMLEVVDGVSKCQSFTYNIKNTTDLITNELPLYFFKKAVCCKTGVEIAEWVISIGEAVNDLSSFAMYSEQMLSIYYDYTDPEGEVISTPLWDGMKIIEQHLKGRGISKADGIRLIDKRHEFLFRIIIQKMYTVYLEQVCRGGFLCLQAVNTFTPDNYLISTPFPCPSGSFCLAGSQSVIGTGLCPIGYYCPPETSDPIPTPPGTFSGNQGSVEPSLCSPGSFQLQSKSAKCDSCPSGYQCKERGTTMPQICMAGYYRSVIESNICSMCPKGTFSFERGAKDYLDCQGCPPGRICEIEGITNITQTAPCTDGRVCVSGTGAIQPTDCPEGYYCPEQTTGETMFDNPCVEGFFCRLGTGGSTKTRDNCPQTYFCPPGTGTYDYVTNYTSYDNWKNDAPTRCPRGTGQDGADTKTSLLQCSINSNYKMTIAAIDIRDNFRPVVVKKKVDPVVDTNTTNSTNTTAPSRRLQTIEVASKDDPMLKDLWEIQNEILRSYDVRNEQNKIRSYINIDRQYIMRINPLNLSLCDRWYYNETLDNDTDRNNEPSVIFKLHPNSYALITMDLRHLMEQEYNWVYGEDWDISITIQTTLDINDQATPVLMPETFLHKNTTKSQVLEFQVLAWDMIYMRIDVLIYNTLYINHKLAFVNSTSVEIRTPNRAIYGTEEIFIATLQDDFMIMLPFNHPPLQADKTSMPEYLVTFAQYKEGNFTQLRHVSTKNRNIWIPSSLYWNQRPLINIAYLPYFSNCNGYGSYVPLWSVYEQNNKCKQYGLDEINYMNEFSFGQSPTADNCDQTIINCVFDEIPSDQQPLSRWFEVDSGTPIFNIVVDPADYEDFMTRSFTDFDVLNVAPENGNKGDGWIPTNFDFVISYFQKGPKVKKIIIVRMDYTPESVIKLTDDQYTGLVPINYNLTFSFLPLSHKDLLVMFAFQSYLYIVLYIVIGILSIANMVILGAFHRIVARPYQGRIAGFRFFSFLKLTTPPAFGGIMLALAPICVGQMLIIIIMTGKFLTYNMNIFECDSPVANDCQYTLFDLIKDDPDNISVDYQKLRTGRCGVSLLASGVYQLFVGLSILIPDTSDKRKVQESYNGNIWNFYEWKRSNMIFCSLWVILFSVIVIQFSFSEIFGDYIWTMVISIKAIGIGIDWLLEKALEDSLLVMPLSITLGTVLGLVTFGSDDFLAFIDSYFIEFGIMLFERCYLGSITDIFFDYIENKLPQVIKSFLTWINNDNQDEGEVDLAKNLFGNNQKNVDSETSDSKVLLSDENSLLDDMIAGSDEERDQNLIFRVHADWNESASNSELSAKFKKPEKRNFSLGMTTTNQSAMGISYDSESVTLSSGQLEGSQSTSQGQEATLEDSIVEQEVEPLIEAYAGFASENVTLFFNPYFVLILWVFYDETVVAKMYGIKSYDFVYYFLFALTIVPFQIVVDIIQFNTTEWFHHLPIHDYLDYLKFRFSERKSRWKGNEGKVNTLIAKGLQPLDQLCFSSQFYFVQTIYVSGMCSVILGIQTLLFAEGYNMFGDFGTFPVMGFTIIKCVIIHRVSLILGNWIGIWKIDTAIQGKQTVTTSSNDDLFILLEMITAFQKEELRADQGEEAPDHLKFKLKAWNQIDRIKIKDQQLKADLRTDRMMAENFKDLFLQYNKPWLRENLQEVLTPRTIFAKRAEIINQLGQILGPIDPDVSMSVSKKSQNSDSQKSSLSESEILKKKHKARLGRLAKKFGIGGDKLQALISENKITPISRVIIKYWVTRMRVIRKLRVYVQGIVDLNLEKCCQFCGYTYGLLVELMQSIEDMFYTFLKKNNLNINNFSFPLWIKYFKENARYRTVCQECLAKIEHFHKMRYKKKQLAEIIGVGYEDDMELIMMKSKAKEAHLIRIGQVSARIKDLIHSWMLVGKKAHELRSQDKGFDQVQLEEYTPNQVVTQGGSEVQGRQREDEDDIDISRLLEQWQF